ncbi:MAG TPA: AMP-binding protein, partial [Dehalococcoidia bacterium]|nr:AMP-binding protein [Dehalococcoidia bacterium]
MQTLVDLLEEAAAGYSDRPSLSIDSGAGGDAWSYSRLWRAAHAVARYLREEQGIQRGERVLVWAPNSPQLVAAYFGAMLAGIVLVPLDAYSAPDFVGRIAQRSQPTAIITGAGQEPPVAGLRTISLSGLPFDAEGPLLEERPLASDIVEIVFTSGTTGDPKGVVLAHGNIVANIDSVSGLIPRGPHYRLLSLLPLSHMLEQTAGLYLPLSYRATIHYAASRLPSVIFKAMGEHRITCMVVVPQVLDLFLKGIEREVRQRGQERRWRRAHRVASRLPFPLRRLLFRQVLRSLGGALDFFMCGGAYLPPPLADAWERMGVKVVQGYGATECSPVVTSNSLKKRVASSVGRPVRNVQVRLGEDGEVLVRGPNVFSGYWQNEEATRAAFTEDGWYCTGDLGVLDKGGYLYLKGRKKDLIVLANGMNVYPEDVENELKQEEAVRDCVVVGLTDPSGDVQVHAVILPAVQGEADEIRRQVDEAVRRANARLSL